VHGIHGLHRKAVEKAIGNHGPRAAAPFLGRLKDQHGRAVEAPRRGQVAGGAHQHGRMAVMPAAVHQPLLAGLPGKFVVLDHGQCVHVGTQAHHGARTVALPADHGHQARGAQAFMDLVHTTLAQGLLDARRREALLESQLRMRMQLAAQRRQLRVVLGDLGKGPTACLVSSGFHSLGSFASLACALP